MSGDASQSSGAKDQWIEAGMPEPMAAEEVADGEGECTYEDCDADADYRVQMDDGATFLICQDCSVENRIYVRENELLELEVDEDAGL